VVLTVTAHGLGLLEESNPIAARLLLLGPSALVAYKFLLLIFASTVLASHRHRQVSEIAAAGTLVIYAIVAVQWRLCYEFYVVIAGGDVTGSKGQVLGMINIVGAVPPG